MTLSDRAGGVGRGVVVKRRTVGARTKLVWNGADALDWVYEHAQSEFGGGSVSLLRLVGRPFHARFVHLGTLEIHIVCLCFWSSIDWISERRVEDTAARSSLAFYGVPSRPCSD